MQARDTGGGHPSVKGVPLTRTMRAMSRGCEIGQPGAHTAGTAANLICGTHATKEALLLTLQNRHASNTEWRRGSRQVTTLST